jgi:hypothetical protein
MRVTSPNIPVIPRYISTALIICATSIGSNAWSAEIVKLDPPPRPSATILLGDNGPGQWRDKTQLVWDAGVQKLTRRHYQIWDPYAAQALDLFWVPLDASLDKSGVLNGRGRLLWRSPGAASYDEDATFVEYDGDFVEGRAQGNGELRERSGAYYRGGWKAGLMDGQGRLHFENGDEYVGSFKTGRLDGNGTYIYPTGEVYSGGFVSSVREGAGHLHLASGFSYSAVWRRGEEVLGTRQNERKVLQVQLQSDNVRVGVTADRRKLRDQNAFADVMAYISESRPEGLRIFPDDQRVLDVWRGNAEIQFTEDDDQTIKIDRSFLGPPERYKPVPIIFDVQNHSNAPLSISAAYLEVANSISDRDPAVQVIGPLWGGCGGPTFLTSLDLENFGWGDLQNAKITGRFLNEDGTEAASPFVAELGKVGDKAKTDTVEPLKSAGVDIMRMSASEFKCGEADEDMCLALARNEGVFGGLKNAVRLNDVYFYLPMKSTLEYDWSDATGTFHHKVSPFTVNLAVGTRELTAECGEGSLPEARFRDPFPLKVDAQNYRIPIPLQEDIPAGVTGRWRIQLDAAMSSSHDFKIVVELADGRDISSRPINLLYFKPKPHPDLHVAGEP